MKIKIPFILTRSEFEKISKAFSDSNLDCLRFDLLSDIKCIHFDSDRHILVTGDEIESVSARVELK